MCVLCMFQADSELGGQKKKFKVEIFLNKNLLG